MENIFSKSATGSCFRRKQDRLNYQKPNWCPSFKKHLTEIEIVDRLFSYSAELKIGYNIYQEFLLRVKKRDFLGLVKTTHLFQVSIKLRYNTFNFKKYNKQIKDALRHSESKDQWKTYDFRDFYNFELHIFLYQEKALERI